MVKYGLPENLVNEAVDNIANSFPLSPLQGGKLLQISESRSLPTHTRPPKAGAGFPQERCLYRLPTSQDLEHELHSDHDVHCPLRVQFVTLTTSRHIVTIGHEMKEEKMNSAK